MLLNVSVVILIAFVLMLTRYSDAKSEEKIVLKSVVVEQARPEDGSLVICGKELGADPEVRIAVASTNPYYLVINQETQAVTATPAGYAKECFNLTFKNKSVWQSFCREVRQRGKPMGVCHLGNDKCQLWFLEL
jgi:hypothetical protein